MTSKLIYYYRTKFTLPLFLPNRKVQLALLQKSLDEVANDAPQASYSDYVEDFGTPKEYVAALLEELPPSDVKKSLKFNTYSAIIIAVLILILVFTIALCIHLDATSTITIVENPPVIEYDFSFPNVVPNDNLNTETTVTQP